jgi:hypothetical protein
MTAYAKNDEIRKSVVGSDFINMMNVELNVRFFTKITLMCEIMKRFFSIKRNFIRNLSFKHTFVRAEKIWSAFISILRFQIRKFIATNDAIFRYSSIKRRQFVFTSYRTTNLNCSFEPVWERIKILFTNWTRNFAFIDGRSSNSFHVLNSRRKRELCL